MYSRKTHIHLSRYDGLFLPYQQEWANLGPINQGAKKIWPLFLPHHIGLDQYNVTDAKMVAYYEAIQKAGFHSLSYFDMGLCSRGTFSYDFDL